MSEIKWIKLDVEIFNNDKIKLIRQMPAGDTIMLIWIYMLTYAGKSNEGGKICIAKDLPLDCDMLASVSGFNVNDVRVALNTFERLHMISWIKENDEFICITNWEEYQSVEKMRKIKEDNAERKRKQRAREKLAKEEQLALCDNGVTSCDMSRDSHSDVIIQNKEDKEREKDKENKEKKTQTYNNTPVTQPKSSETIFDELIREYNISDELGNKIREWTSYKDSREEGYVEQSLKPLLKKLETMERIHGADKCIELIDNAMMNGWKNIQWAHLENNGFYSKPGKSNSYIDAINSRVDAVDSWFAGGGE